MTFLLRSWPTFKACFSACAIAVLLFTAGETCARDANPTTRDFAPITSAAERPQIASVIGDYFFGDGLNNNHTLKLTASGSFSYELATYESTVDKAEGHYTIVDGKVVLRVTSGKASRWPAGITTEMLPVPWNERMYLVPSNDLLGFCNAINRGAEPIMGFTNGKYLLLEGDGDKEVTGKPQLPESYAGLILDTPVSGRVLCADQQGYWKVGAGREEGLKPGMELWARSPDDQLTVTVRVVQVDEHTALVEAGNLAPELAQHLPKAQKLSLTDWTVSSRLREILD